MALRWQLSVLILFITTGSLAQVGIGTSTPHSSAALEISATDKGVLIPRLTTNQRNSISDPQPGTIIYNTTDSKFQGFGGATLSLNTNPNSQTSGGYGWALDEYVSQTFVANSSAPIKRVDLKALALAIVNGSLTQMAGTASVVAFVYEGTFNPNSNPPQVALATSNNTTVSTASIYSFVFSTSFSPTIGTTYSVVFKNFSLPSHGLSAFELNPSTYNNGNVFWPGNQSNNTTDLDIQLYTNGTWNDLH